MPLGPKIPDFHLPLTTEVDYCNALRRFEEICDKLEHTEELDRLGNALHSYEEGHYPVKPLSYEELQKYCRDLEEEVSRLQAKIDWENAPLAPYEGEADPSVKPVWPDRATDEAEAKRYERLKIAYEERNIPEDLVPLWKEVVEASEEVGCTIAEVLDANIHVLTLM